MKITAIIKHIWENPLAFILLGVVLAFSVSEAVNDHLLATYREAVASQQATIASLQHLNAMHEQLEAVNGTNSVLQLKTISLISSAVTMKCVAEAINSHVESISFENIWSQVVDAYNSSDPPQKLDAQKAKQGASQETVKALESMNKRSRL